MRKYMLPVVFAAAFIGAFNESFINTALVDIMAEFSIDAGMAQWLVSGYMVVTAIVVTVVAFLIKRFEFRMLFSVSAVVMAIGSALCMVAPTFPILLVSRLVSCVGAGFFVPAMMSVTVLLAPENKMASYLAIGNATATVGPAVGPFVAGAIVTAVGWRFTFLAPLVFIVVVFIAGLFIVHEVGPLENLKLDTLSFVLAAVGLTLFVLGIGQMTTMFAVGGVSALFGMALIVAFVVRQERIDNPLLDLAPVHVKGFMPATMLVFCTMMAAFSLPVLLPFFYEISAGLTAFAAGSLLVLPVIANIVTAVAAGRIMDRYGEWPLLPAGYFAIAFGTVLVAAFGVLGIVPAVVMGSVIAFIGVGLTFATAMASGLKRLDKSINAYGVGIMQVLTQASTCIGPSLLVGIMSAVTSQQSAAGAAGPAAQAAGFSAATFALAAFSCAALIGSVLYAHHTCD